MKTIGIIAAMDEEITFIKSGMDVVMTKSAAGTEFFIGSINGKNAVLVKCGVGKVNAAICAQILIDQFAADCVINTGIAGAINRNVKIGDVVISTDVVQHDFDCTHLGFAPGEIPWMEKSVFEADDAMTSAAQKAASELCLENEFGIFCGRIASGDLFVADNSQKKKIWESFSPYCVEMEGAAIAQTCTLNKIPFVIIRSISDNADADGEAVFKEFTIFAAKRAQKLTEKIVGYL